LLLPILIFALFYCRESAAADLLFEDLPDKTPAAYRCIIRGMSKAGIKLQQQVPKLHGQFQRFFEIIGGAHPQNHPWIHAWYWSNSF
jgi:hypothetical protein